MKDAIEVRPMDSYNHILVDNVHPQDWVNPEPAETYDMVVLGAGTAGLVSAAITAALGGKVALVEKNLLGGDCLNVGCVPSKCLIRSSRVMGEINRAAEYGVIVPQGVRVDFPAVMQRMRRIRSEISHHDSVERFRKEYDVDVFLGEGRFINPETIEVEGKELHFTRAVIATGARAVHPTIEGLQEAGFLTNETVFSLSELPERLLVIGGGPIGCELAQAFRRFGSEVTIVQKGPQFLPKEDPEAAGILEKVFREEGIRVLLDSTAKTVELINGKRRVHLATPDGLEEVEFDQILVGAGRTPNVEGMGLEEADVEYDIRKGVHVDDRLRTTSPRIFAAGDCCMQHKFTHAADFAARNVIQNAFFFGRKHLSDLIIPWCTYTDPEIAHVGVYEKDAHDNGTKIETYRKDFRDVDRALADGETKGFVKIHVKKGSDHILGATIVAAHAGEMLGEITTAMVADVGLGKIAEAIHAYPTQSEAIRQCGDQYRRTKLTSFVKGLLRRVLERRR